MLNSIFTSALIFQRASITSFSFCLFTWVVYCVMFMMVIMCTKVSCCFVCSCINWFICHLLFLVSFIMAVPVKYCSASPEKGNRHLLGHGLLVVTIYWELVKSGVVVLLFVRLVYTISRCCWCWWIPLEGCQVWSWIWIVGVVSLIVHVLMLSDN